MWGKSQGHATALANSNQHAYHIHQDAETLSALSN